MRRIFVLSLLSLAAQAAFCAGASDACLSGKKRFDDWVECRIARAGTEQTVARQTQQNPAKQTDSPAISSSATSLVDHTSLADFVTGALDVAGYGNGSSQSPSGTTTVSAYAMYSAILAQDPLDPVFYNDHINWRRFTVSVGTDSPATGNPGSGSTATTSSSTKSTSGSAGSSSGSSGTAASKVVGAAFLLVNHRDLASAFARKQINDAAINSGGIAERAANASQDVLNALFAAYRPGLDPASAAAVPAKADLQVFSEDGQGKGQGIITSLEQDTSLSAALDAIFKSYAPGDLADKAAVKAAVQRIQSAFQLSVTGQATIADSQAQNSDYRAEIVAERGLSNGFNFTGNASFDYVNSHVIGGDTRGGRAALDIQRLFITNKTYATGKKPISLDFSGEGDWFQTFHPSYVGQVKLTIPLVSGIDLPLSFSYASSADLLHEAHAIGKLGLTFDLARIASALSKR